MRLNYYQRKLMINSSENYKETGVDWILKIPNDWDVSRAKYLFKNKSLKNFPDEPLLSVHNKMV